MREIKIGDKYLCNNDEWTNFTKGNIYEVNYAKNYLICFIDDNENLCWVHKSTLATDFKDLQQANDIKVNYEIVKPKNETKEHGLRYNEGKERWSLVDFEALKPMVKVLEFGAKKYDDHNWKKGLKTTEICESLLRHLTAYLNGENNDKETNISHVGHILCNAMFLSYMMQNKPEFDTRYNKPCCGNWDKNGQCKCKKNG